MKCFNSILIVLLFFQCNLSIAEDKAVVPPSPDLDGIFKDVMGLQLPMTAEQIKRFQHKLDQTAEAIHPGPPAKLISRSINLSFEPGQSAPTLRLAPGYVSSLIFVDGTGSPWPISTHTVGNDKWFSVIRPENAEKNMLTVNALTNYVNSNVTVTLEGRDTPVIINLEMRDSSIDKKAMEADALLSVRMQGAGPNAKPPIIGESISSVINPDILSFLDGIPPGSAKSVSLTPSVPDVKAWVMNGRLYVRSIHPVRWPARISVSQGSGGISLYVLPVTSTINISVNGNSQTIGVH